METTTTLSTESTAATTAATVARSFAEQSLGEKTFSLFILGLGAVISGAFVYYLITDPTRGEGLERSDPSTSTSIVPITQSCKYATIALRLDGTRR